MKSKNQKKRKKKKQKRQWQRDKRDHVAECEYLINKKPVARIVANHCVERRCQGWCGCCTLLYACNIHGCTVNYSSVDIIINALVLCPYEWPYLTNDEY